MKTKKPKIGLALGSGGARGLTIIGVLKTLEKHNINIDYIAGSSIGAIFGGAYASEKDIKKIEKLTLAIESKEIFSSLIDFSKSDGLIEGNKMIDKLRSYIGNQRIENLKIPFSAVATNKDTGNAVIIDKGDLINAMRASSSMPFVFASYKHQKNKLIDGGVAQSVPVAQVKKMGADIVIAVNINENVINYNPNSKISTMHHYILLLFRSLARENCRNADIVIAPKFKSVSWRDNFENRKKLIKEGERVTKKQIAAIADLIEKY